MRSGKNRWKRRGRFHVWLIGDVYKRQLRNRAHCYYLMALGNIGLGNKEKAAEFIKEAVAIEPSHMMCRIYGNMVK